ncbi:type VI secretion system PAAR protein [Buttiauxella sp.]|uniref:type VI secretion system PAAR protein n=1 Tax=Buttiauxella sp. TaxID=1972222 RepID=UPI003C75AC9A
MPLAAKLNDQGTEHDGFHSTPITAGSPTVCFDGLPAARLGDPLVEHSKPPHHPRVISSGWETVFIDGAPATRTGDSISCGGIVIGSGTVHIG